MRRGEDSVFREYYTQRPFVDRFAEKPDGAVDVIIPLIHTNELWEVNLHSLYREIPIHRLLIGDAGCTDDSIEVVRQFPRVEVLDHRHIKTQGYSQRALIEAVKTDWFIYVHSDVYLPPGWFDTMRAHQGEYDWFGCAMRSTIMVEYEVDYGVRPWMGSQMGRREAFEANIGRIDDDFVYRQEEEVLADVVKRGGYRVGGVSDTFHYHQLMRKQSPTSRKVTSVSISVDMDRAEEIRTWRLNGHGIVKYLQPDSEWAVTNARYSFDRLEELGELDWNALRRWIGETNPAWLPVLRRRRVKKLLARYLQALSRRVAARLRG